MTQKVLTWEEWETLFEPVTNNNSQGWFFETYGEEYETVKNAPAQNVWTVVDGDGILLDVVNGLRWVNRLAYCITKHPAEINTDYYITNQKG